ncbi:hypothetical protein [Streptomyces natalensis]|uniref:HK97 gp10 family phage protein n=1 Tax=Streptomyces natalensis ATCC 27448 TaxID=1240678 RepID=A0A0D7CLW0_9ACTN|nr:hypothetical protein [Streptomyces natalensis]KIZ16830.1 hypothetical protein SNA_17680 [Streptomyces natalensis ATCC 27448]
MDGITVTGLQGVVDDLEMFPGRLLVNVRKAVQITSLKIKRDAQSRVSGHPRWVHYPRTITYDTKVTAEGIEGEIGPDKSLRGQAPYGAIIEFGTSVTAPIPHLGPALDANAEDLVTGIEIAVNQAIT